MENNIRHSRVAGSFYPANPNRLANEINTLLEDAEDCQCQDSILAAAVPHAGYVYSAHIAAPVFKALRDVEFDTIVIIGHDFGPQAGIIAVLPEYEYFQTPLGNVEVDQELCNALVSSESRIIYNNRVHSEEHSIEVQLPFLQLTHPGVKIVPILFGEATPDNCRILAELLMENAGDRKIFVLSSTDLSHYPTDKAARELDRNTVLFAERYNINGLCQWQKDGEWRNYPGVETPICSAGGLGVAMLWAKMHGGNKVIVTKRGNSSDASGDTERVVGYASMLFVKTQNGKVNEEEPSFSLSEKAQETLLKLARASIKMHLLGNEIDLRSLSKQLNMEELDQKAAVFVTLEKQGRLRGCIGTTVAMQPLLDAVADYAIAAAFQDPRFPEVEMHELDDITIEISVLSPMKQIASADEIRPGKDGVVVRRGGRSGLFLPQVWEQLPNKEQFMGYLCAEKAGLPFEAWRDKDTQLFTFTVFSFTDA